MMMPSRRLSVGHIIFGGGVGPDATEDAADSCPAWIASAREDSCVEHRKDWTREP